MAPRLLVVSPPPPLLLLLLLLLARALPAAARSVPAQASFLEDVGGSGEADADDDASASPPSLPPPPPPPPPRTPGLGLGATPPRAPQPTPPAGPRPPTNFLDGIVDFFREYVLLIAVVGSLVLLAMFIVCAAVVTRQKHKASAYYPSSFPRRKYVDQRDRAGGPRAFSEVPDRAPAGRPEEALDSSQQLQADILAASQNLRSPARAAPSGGGDGGAGVAEGRPGEEEEEERTGGQKEEEEEEDRDAPGRGVPTEKPGVTEGPRSGPAGGVLGPREGPGEPEAAPSSAQEAGDPAGPRQSPCACGSVTPSV